MSDCLFCRIVKREIPAAIVHEDALSVAFEDINPKAPTHVLIVPRAHLPTTNDVLPEHESVIGHLVGVAAKIARDRGFAQDGYRTVLNCNTAAGQTVYHVHLHLLGGRTFEWPPG